MIMIQPDEVESLYEDFKRAEASLLAAGEISALNTLSVVFKNNLVLTSASNSERMLTAFFEDLLANQGLMPHLALFCKKSAFDQRYHTFFDWKCAESESPEKGVEGFVSKFGQQFKAEHKKQIIDSPSLRQGAASFIQIGHQRNEMVHTGFTNYTNEKTNAEIIEHHRAAIRYLKFSMRLITEYTVQELDVDVN